MTWRRGFMLWELTVAIGLVATFGVVSARLMTTTIRLMARAEADHDRLARVESLTSLLRQDVWSAGQIGAVPGGVELSGDGQTVSWTVNGPDIQRVVRRGAAASGPQRWPGVGEGVALVPTQTGVSLSVRTPDGRGVERIPLPSELLMLKGVKR